MTNLTEYYLFVLSRSNLFLKTAATMDSVRTQLLHKNICKTAFIKGNQLSTDLGVLHVKFGTGGKNAGIEMLEYEVLKNLRVLRREIILTFN